MHHVSRIARFDRASHADDSRWAIKPVALPHLLNRVYTETLTSQEDSSIYLSFALERKYLNADPLIRSVTSLSTRRLQQCLYWDIIVLCG